MSCTKRSSDFVGKSYRDHNVNREVGEFRSDDRTQLKNYELSLHSFTHRVNDGVLKGVSNIWVWGVTIQIKALLQYFHMVLFIWYVFLTFESVDEILWCYHLNETSSAVLSQGTIYLVCTVVATFESVDQILWCDYSYETSLAVLSHGTISCSAFSKKKFGYFCLIFILATSGNKRVLTSHAVSSHLKTMAPTTQSSSLALQFESDRASHLNILQLTTDPN